MADLLQHIQKHARQMERHSRLPSSVKAVLGPLLRSFLGIAALLIVVELLQRLPFIHRLLANAPHWHETPFAHLWFLLLAVPYCAFGLPRQALCIAAGLAFGLWVGLGLSSVAYVLGALMLYGWARLLAPVTFRMRQKRRLKERFGLLSRILNRTPFRAVLTLRLMPAGSALLVSLAAGIFELPPSPFLVATFLGGLPQNLVFVLIGAGVRIGHAVQLGLAALLFACSGALGALLLWRNRRDIAENGPADIGKADDIMEADRN